MPTTLNDRLQSLKAQRAGVIGTARAIADAAGRAGRTQLTRDEDDRVTRLFAERDSLDGQIEALSRAQEDEDKRAAVEGQTTRTGARPPVARVTAGATPVYQRESNHDGPSWIKDMVAASLRGDADASARLRENTRAVAGELNLRALNTTDGAGGDFVPPLWLMKDLAELARPGRVTANLVRQEALPAGTDSINLPKVATGTATAEQATQNTAVQNTDATTATVTSNVATIAGQQVVSVQMIEQSAVDMSAVLLRDLLNDLATKTDAFVLSNNVAGKRGLLSVPGINPITYTDATPTVPELYPKVADAIQQINTGRFLPADAIVMHPRRWAWMAGAVDPNGRPLVVPNANSPHNTAAATSGLVDTVTGFVGTLQGVPVYLDPVMPVNLGAGTNEDRIIVLRRDDHILYEGTPRAEVFRETYANQLSVLLRVYNYVATAFERFPKSISVIGGTGLITPTF